MAHNSSYHRCPTKHPLARGSATLDLCCLRHQTASALLFGRGDELHVSPIFARLKAAHMRYRTLEVDRLPRSKFPTTVLRSPSDSRRLPPVERDLRALCNSDDEWLVSARQAVQGRQVCNRRAVLAMRSRTYLILPCSLESTSVCGHALDLVVSRTRQRIVKCVGPISLTNPLSALWNCSNILARD